MSEAVCNRDCFHCPYPDCVVDGETPLEIARSERRDHVPKPSGMRSRAAANRRYRQRKPEIYRESNRRYYAAHRAEIAERKREWYRKNRKRVLAQQKEYRKRKKEKDGNETQA